ncbi:hypothetical protein F6455_06930 [Proteobacteria bacterium 005FR1]|nr:hypothetical protein [Proteobacteria bacterium 005FR1]
MNLSEQLQTLLEHLKSSTGTSKVFGEPICEHGRTIVPVAKLAYGFGGGLGESGSTSKSTGSGAGGGIAMKPVGVIEISEQGTRYVPVSDTPRLLAAMGLGVIIGMLLKRR